MPSAPKKLFLVDAMAHIYRAFYAPMNRMNAPSGIPTKVPFLFANILRRLLKDYQPDYIGIVFDTKGPTFRDKLFEKYKAQRPPMPDDLSVQIPSVRKLCEAMRLPILEFHGYEADDVIGAMAAQAAKKQLDVLIVTNDKDMMQLVGKNIRTLRTGSGGAKADVIVDEKGAGALTRKHWSVEKVLERADEVSNKRYRESLPQQSEQGMMSKQHAT